MLKRVVALLLLCALPALVHAQDATETASGTLPPLAGDYSVTQKVGSDSMDGRMTIEGTGPIYRVTVGAADGSGSATAAALAQGNILTAAGGSSDCAPATLVRQSDGTLFGQWIDKSVSDYSLGVEVYAPKAKTTDFAGEYDFIGTYANGAQYRGTATIKKDESGIYTLSYSYSADETAPQDIPGAETGSGIAIGNVLGYAFTQKSGTFCGALVVKVNPDGTFAGEFTASTTNVGEASGEPKK